MPSSEIFLNIQTDSKAEEQTIIEQFLTRLEYPVTDFRSSERPDFEINIMGNSIGVEVTKYYSDFGSKGSAMQQKLSEWKKYATIIKQVLTKIDPEFDYLYGAIHFLKEKINYKLLLQDKYIKEIVNCIKFADIQRGQHKTIEITVNMFPLLSEFVESIYLLDNYPENKYLWWDASLQSGEVIHKETAIQMIVEKKEISAKKYSKNYFQKWLIVYAGGLGLADIFVEFENDSFRQGKVFVTKLGAEYSRSVAISAKSDYFTHIFIWDKFHERIFQLFPYYKKIFDYGEKKIWVNHLPIALSAKCR